MVLTPGKILMDRKYLAEQMDGQDWPLTSKEVSFTVRQAQWLRIFTEETVKAGVFLLTARGISPTGTQNFGGCLVTAGGLLFIGASADEKFRAFDKASGEILWEYKLPYGGYATPAIYEVDHEQYVVIAAGGGGKVGTKSGDVCIAFKLVKKK
jgi:outer membrane protein assembly factor BamB